ncbi:MAG: hypothetical protein ACRD5I_05410 [Candidatus Acidiferrales bacterium]
MIAVGAFLALALSPSAAWSQCNEFTFTIPDGRIQTDFIAGAGDEGFFFNGTAGHSYSIEISMDTSSLAGPSAVHFGAAGVSCPSADAAGFRNTTFIDPISNSCCSERQSFTATAGGTPFYVTRVINGTDGVTYRYTVSDTTLFNPLWSTSGGFETFYRFQNTTNAVCNVTLTMRNDAGALVGGTPVTFPIPANSTVPTRNTGAGDLNVANGLAGSATIAHDCPPGGVQVDGFTGIFGATTAVLPIKIVPAREAAH